MAVDLDRNPFATRHLAPNTVAFRDDPNHSLSTLRERLSLQEGWGEIVGPHGVGKSTLLHALLDELRANGGHVELAELHSGARALPPSFLDQARAALPPSGIIAVDGFEQLTCWARRRLQRLCRQRHWGLLVTCHRPLGLPLLVELRPSPDRFQGLVANLVNDYPAELHPTPEVVARAYQQHQGNLREALFTLYDDYALRRRNAKAAKPANAGTETTSGTAATAARGPIS